MSYCKQAFFCPSLPGLSHENRRFHHGSSSQRKFIFIAPVLLLKNSMDCSITTATSLSTILKPLIHESLILRNGLS